VTAEPVKIAFVQSLWHSDIVDQGRESFVAEMATLGVPREQIDFFAVPGAFEIPLHARRLAASGRYAAVVGAGLVVDGGIYRHEFVAEAVISGLMRVQLDTNVPIISVVLTPHHFHEHDTHTGFFAEHFALKGAEGARACMQTIDSLQRLAA
jgi:6,7-dimethyl-8-ribityllumazine synthase